MEYQDDVAPGLDPAPARVIDGFYDDPTVICGHCDWSASAATPSELSLLHLRHHKQYHMVKYCWVVVSDYGLNGVHVHGVYTTEPDAEMVKRFVDAQAVTPDGFHYRISGTTGYSGTEILMFQLDGTLT